MGKIEIPVKFIEHKVERLKQKISQYPTELTPENYTCYGGWSKGYLEGRLDILLDLCDYVGLDID